MTNKLFVEARSKGWLNTQALQDKDTHSDGALARRIMPISDCMKQNQNDKVMRPVCVYDKRSEAFIAL